MSQKLRLLGNFSVRTEKKRKEVFIMRFQSVCADYEVVKRVNAIKLQDLIAVNRWYECDEQNNFSDFISYVIGKLYFSDDDIIQIAYDIAMHSGCGLYDIFNETELSAFVQNIAFQINRTCCTTFYKINSIKGGC